MYCLLFCYNYTYFIGSNEYDLAVIGGGSGGLACAKEGNIGIEAEHL